MKERRSGLRSGLIGAIAFISAITGVVDGYNYEPRREAYVDSIIPPINPEQLERASVDYNRMRVFIDSLILNNPDTVISFVVGPNFQDAVSIVYQDRRREKEKDKFDAEPVNIVRRPIDLLAFVCGIGTLLSVTKPVPPKEPKEYVTPSDKNDLDGL